MIGELVYVVTLARNRDGEPTIELHEKRRHRGVTLNLAWAVGRMRAAQKRSLPQLSLWESQETPRVETRAQGGNG